MSQLQINQTEQECTWRAPYEAFEHLAHKILENPNIISHPGAEARIEKEVDALYAQHKGEPAWDLAYQKWKEGDTQ